MGLHRIFNKLSLLALLSVPLLSGCSDERVNFEIDGKNHALTMIRVITFPWEKVAAYSIVASRMPDCMRRHPYPERMLNIRTEVYNAGNDAWILKQSGRLYVTETRTCEGFAPLEKAPDDGLGDLMGVFEMKNGTLVFSPAPKQ